MYLNKSFVTKLKKSLPPPDLSSIPAIFMGVKSRDHRMFVTPTMINLGISHVASDKVVTIPLAERNF
jgi:hypothetical protein